jgi:predicted nucleic acid-binding protein
MASVLLDTTVATLLHPKKQQWSAFRLYDRYLVGNTLVISFQTAAELLLWGVQNRWGAAALAQLDVFLARFVITPYDDVLGRHWARVMASARSTGRRLESGDAWIAATAIRLGLPLITHDADFRGLRFPGLKVICHAP